MGRRSRRVKTPNGGGSILLRSDGRWMARYSVRDPDTGRLVQKCLYGRTEAEARAKLVQALADRERGVLGLRRGKAPTLGQYVSRWLATREVTRPNSTSVATSHRLMSLSSSGAWSDAASTIRC